LKEYTSISNTSLKAIMADIRKTFMDNYDNYRGGDGVNFAENFVHLPKVGAQLQKFQTSLFDKIFDLEKEETRKFIATLTDDQMTEWMSACLIKPEEVKPEEVKPEEVKPEEVKPEEVKPEEVKPEEVKPEEVKPE